MNLLNMLIKNARKFLQVINPPQTHIVAFTNESGELKNDAECANVFITAFLSLFTAKSNVSFAMLPTNTGCPMSPVTFLLMILRL